MDSYVDRLNILGSVCAIVFLACPVTIGVQAASWLETGAWSIIPVNALLIWIGMPYPCVDWFNIQALLDALLDAPLFVAAMPFGLPLLVRPRRA
jgi:hypothetical protein